MAYLTWLADVLRGAGLPVREVAGWRTRGHGGFSEPSAGGVLGVLAHHTAGPASGLFPSENIVVNGRTDLPGPLANLGLARDGTWIVIAAGQAWHAGTGSIAWCPANQGNSHLIGVEAESVGTRDDWTAAQRTSYPRGVAALLRHLNLPASRAIAHREWAPGRKVDPAFWDMGQFRTAVSNWLATAASPTDWFDMATKDELRAVIREELATMARRDDVGHARGQILTALGVDDPITAPPQRTPEENAAIAPARRVDVRFAYDELRKLLPVATGGSGPSGPVALTDSDVQRIAAAVAKLLGQKISASGA